MDLRKRAGVISSVLTLVRSSGITRPVRVVKGSMILFLLNDVLLCQHTDKLWEPQFIGMLTGLYFANIYKVSGDGGGGGHSGADKMCAPTTSLASLKVAVAGGGTAFALAEAVAVHSDTHATASFA